MRLYREDRYLVVIFIAISFAIVIKSYFDINGYLSNDSMSYLQCVQALSNGNGYNILVNNRGVDRELFAVWPIGYPSMVFLIYKITPLSIFWASKLLNISLLAIIFSLFRAIFKRDSYLYASIFLFASYIEMFSYTWSEPLFVTLLLIFSTTFYLFILEPKSKKKLFLLYLALFLSSLALFLTRYIGAFSFGLIGLLGLYYFFIKRDRLKSSTLISIALVNIIIMALYLYNNYLQTGFPTGMPRISSPESYLYLLIFLIKAFIAEVLIAIEEITPENLKISIIIFMIQFTIFTLSLWRYRKYLKIENKISRRDRLLPIIFTTIGSTYLFFIIYMRWVTQFDLYNYRLLAPATLLIFISLLFYIKKTMSREFFGIFKKIMLSLIVLSYILSVPYKVFSSKQNYYKSVAKIEDRYRDIKDGSIVIFAPNHLAYIYPNISIKKPYNLPYDPYKEKWSDFISRVKSQNQSDIYLHIPIEVLSTENYDKSVIEFLAKYKKDSLIKL